MAGIGDREVVQMRWLRIAGWAAPVLVLTLSVGCGTSDNEKDTSGNPRVGKDASGKEDAVFEVPDKYWAHLPSEECLSEVNCADDSDCSGGERCNFGMTPPQCQKLYCGDEGSICAPPGYGDEGDELDTEPDLLCAEGLECKKWSWSEYVELPPGQNQHQ